VRVVSGVGAGPMRLKVTRNTEGGRAQFQVEAAVQAAGVEGEQSEVQFKLPVRSIMSHLVPALRAYTACSVAFRAFSVSQRPKAGMSDKTLPSWLLMGCPARVEYRKTAALTPTSPKPPPPHTNTGQASAFAYFLLA